MENSELIEQPEVADTPPPDPPPAAPWPAGVEPDDPPPPRGRPWAKGHSGNPAGRPPKRAHLAAYVSNGRINRKTLPLTERLIELAWAGDRKLLQHLHRHITPPRREMPIDLRLPPIEDRAGVRAAMKAVADAAMNGTITSAQARALAQTLSTILYAL